MIGKNPQTLLDKILAWLLGGAVALIAVLSGNNVEFPPELWEKIAVAAKLRPPTNEFPLLFQISLSWFVERFGISACVDALKILGPLALGLLSVVSYRLLSGYLPPIMKGDMKRTKLGRWLIRALVIQSVLIFVCSEAVWFAGRVLSPEIFMLIITLLVFLFALFAVEKSSSFYFILACGISGVVASENLFAFLIPFVLRYHLISKYRTLTDADEFALANPLVFSVAMRRAAFLFVLCFVCSCAVNISFYTSNGGGGEVDVNMFNAASRYLLNYFTQLKYAMTPMGWLLTFVIIALPLVVVTFKLQALTDDQKILPVHHACLLLLAGGIALLQSSGFSGFHFWKWEINAVHDQYLLCLALLGSSILTMMVMSVFIVDVFQRNYPKLFQEMFDCENVQEPAVLKVVKGLKAFLKYLRIPILVSPIVFLAFVIPYRFNSVPREMSSIINRIILQTVAECGEASMLFTDGAYDAAIEVEAAAKGKNLKAISMMSKASMYDVALRLRGEKNEENISLLKIGAADALRTWVHGRFDCVSNIAIQLGFELWQYNRLPVPEAAGLVAKTAGFADKDKKEWVSAAKGLSEEIIKFHEKNDFENVGYPELNRLFVFGQWRLARMCRMRANAADRMKDFKLSEEESALADKLDKCNPEWRKVEEKTRWIGLQSSSQLTPREGLKLGLDRADFRMASSYAKRILDTDPNDMNANFALGMKYFTEKLYEKSEIHLKKCLVRAPDEPAVLNNLAVVQLRLGKLDEAETNAVRALKRFPSSSEIKTTLRHVKEARKELRK